MQIKLDKTYKTVDGLEVELYKIHNGNAPVFGAVKLPSDEWVSAQWTLRGEGVYENFNLIEVPYFKPSCIIERYMKLFNYFGLSILIPDEIFWLATDEDGTIFGYFDEPSCVKMNLGSANTGYWDDNNEVYVKIAKIKIIGDWHESKLRVKND